MKHAMKRKELNVAVILEDNYIDYAKVMLHTLFYHHQHRKVVVYVFSTNLGVTSQQIIKRIASKYGGQIEIIILEEKLTNRFPQRGHWPKTVWNSVLIPFYLPKHIDRILYLDIDMVVNGALDTIYDVDLGGCSMLACEDRWIRKHRKGIGYRLRLYDDELKYFNFAVNLMNIPKLRERIPDTIEEIAQFCQENGERMDFIDQDFYNIFCYKSVKYLNPNKYDYVRDMEYPPEHSVRSVSKNAKIIHYASNKPLQLDRVDIFGIIFWKYAVKFKVADEIYRNAKSKYLQQHTRKEFYRCLKEAIVRIGLGK